MAEGEKTWDIIIIGGGVSALAGAMYAGRFEMKTLVIAETLGGTITLTDHVENYPGFKKISGQDLAKRIEEHAREYNIEIRQEKATGLQKSKGLFTVKTRKGTHTSKTVLLAMGTEVKKLGVPGEEEFTNKGVHYCALCDGPVYSGKVIGVVGGSDSAAVESLILAGYAKKVYIVYRREKIRAEPVNYERVMKNRKIEIINNTNVVEIKGDRFVNTVLLDKTYKGKKDLPLDAVFIEVGRKPLAGCAKEVGVALNEKGEIIINRSGETNVRGVYAAGDITNAPFKQAVVGTAEAISSVFSAYNYINAMEVRKK